jgi:hypothetical protein
MSMTRLVVLLGAMAGIGIAVVALRVEQSATLWRIQELQFRETQLRRDIWRQQMELGRLRSPHLVRERVERLKEASAMPADASDEPDEGEAQPTSLPLSSSGGGPPRGSSSDH